MPSSTQSFWYRPLCLLLLWDESTFISVSSWGDWTFSWTSFTGCLFLVLFSTLTSNGYSLVMGQLAWPFAVSILADLMRPSQPCCRSFTTAKCQFKLGQSLWTITTFPILMDSLLDPLLLVWTSLNNVRYPLFYRDQKFSMIMAWALAFLLRPLCRSPVSQ